MTDIELEKQDLRRTWLTLGAIESLDAPTLARLAEALEIQMSTLQKVIARINSPQLPGVDLVVEEGVYRVASWGILDQRSVTDWYRQWLGGNSDEKR